MIDFNDANDSGLQIQLIGPKSNKPARQRQTHLKSELRRFGENEELKSDLDLLIKSSTAFMLEEMRPYLSVRIIPRGSTLIMVPSTTGINSIPIYLGLRIKKFRPDLTILNTEEDWVETIHSLGAKAKDNYSFRMKDPRNFGFFSNKKWSSLRNKPLYLLDDSVSSGETAIVLQRQLLTLKKVRVKGTLSVTVSSKYLVRGSDMKRLYNKLINRSENVFSDQQLAFYIFDTFAGFATTKINQFELSLLRGSLSLQPHLAFEYIKVMSNNYRKKGIDPFSIIEIAKGIPIDKDFGQTMEFDF